jgi:hypothetical protein
MAGFSGLIVERGHPMPTAVVLCTSSAMDR